MYNMDNQVFAKCESQILIGDGYPIFQQPIVSDNGCIFKTDQVRDTMDAVFFNFRDEDYIILIQLILGCVPKCPINIIAALVETRALL